MPGSFYGYLGLTSTSTPELIRIEQQLQQLNSGTLHIGPVKTRAGQRTLPLLKLAREALEAQAQIQAHYCAEMGSACLILISSSRREPVGRTTELRPLVPADLRG